MKVLAHGVVGKPTLATKFLYRDRRASRVTTDLPKGRAFQRRDHQRRFATIRKLYLFRLATRKPRRFDKRNPPGALAIRSASAASAAARSPRT